MASATPIRIFAAAAMAVLSGSALAQDYPVLGRWTYENASAEGPAENCGQRHMTFEGVRRFDTGGGVPVYRNVGVQQVADDEFRIVEAFNTGSIDGNVRYTLRKIDENRIVIELAGHVIPLRRCK
jgi:hypothetical protein